MTQGDDRPILMSAEEWQEWVRLRETYVPMANNPKPLMGTVDFWLNDFRPVGLWAEVRDPRRSGGDK